METQTTKQLKCSKEEDEKDSKPLSMFVRCRKYAIQVIKIVLRYFLLKPATWHFLMVHVPDLIDRVLQFMKDAYTFFTDFF